MSFTHLDKENNFNIVDITSKKETSRSATANCMIKLSKKTIELIKKNTIQKGKVLEIAQIAGIMGAKQTSNLIPLCHQINLTSTKLRLEINDNKINIIAICKTNGKTGVEMEALTAVSVAALTVYDMCKAIDKNIIITDIKLIEKIGGKSGTFTRKKHI